MRRGAETINATVGWRVGGNHEQVRNATRESDTRPHAKRKSSSAYVRSRLVRSTNNRSSGYEKRFAYERIKQRVPLYPIDSDRYAPVVTTVDIDNGIAPTAET